MQIARRNFLKYASLLGLVGFSGGALFAGETEKVALPFESIGSTHMDEYFDPDGWL